MTPTPQFASTNFDDGGGSANRCRDPPSLVTAVGLKVSTFNCNGLTMLVPTAHGSELRVNQSFKILHRSNMLVLGSEEPHISLGASLEYLQVEFNSGTSH